MKLAEAMSKDDKVAVFDEAVFPGDIVYTGVETLLVLGTCEIGSMVVRRWWEGLTEATVSGPHSYPAGTPMRVLYRSGVFVEASDNET